MPIFRSVTASCIGILGNIKSKIIANVMILKSAFFKAIAPSIKTRGYTIKRGNMFLTPTDFGYVGVRFLTYDYGYLGTILEYCVRHDIVSDAFYRANESWGWQRWEGEALESLKKKMRESITFCMSYNSIVRQKEYTKDEITTEAEIPDLCMRWLQRYDETADQFFSRFTKIDTIVDMFEKDDPFLKMLFNNDFHKAVGRGVARTYFTTAY